MALQEKLGGYLSHPLLKALDEMFPDRLPPLGTPPEEVRDRMAQRQAINEVAPKADEFKSRLYATEANVIKLREELAQLHLYANQCQDNLAAERNLLNRMWEASGCLAGTHVVDHIKLLKADAERWRWLRALNASEWDYVFRYLDRSATHEKLDVAIDAAMNKEKPL